MIQRQVDPKPQTPEFQIPTSRIQGEVDPKLKKARIIARNHYSQIPPREMLHPGVKSTQNGPSWAILGYF